MVIRLRHRAILVTLALYLVSGSVAGYFVWHAVNGQRGLKTKLEYKRQIFALREELAGLRTEREGWRLRTTQMRPEAIDRDLLEEEARATLDWADKRDLVVFLPPR